LSEVKTKKKQLHFALVHLICEAMLHCENVWKVFWLMLNWYNNYCNTFHIC